MKPRKPNESDESYINRLEDRNKDMEVRGKWANKVGRAVTWLAVDASLAFQAMAEKAGVRSHPSVIATVKAFDTIAHPQWTADSAEIGDLSFPTNWDLDPPDAWVGDADMELNSGIAMALEYFNSRRFNCKGAEFKHLCEIAEKLEGPLQGIVQKALPARRERKPIEIPEGATRDDLARAINEISWLAFEVAEDLDMTNALLRRDLRAASYRHAARQLWEISRISVRLENEPEDAIPF